jgi:hypothetical protein
MSWPTTRLCSSRLIRGASSRLAGGLAAVELSNCFLLCGRGGAGLRPAGVSRCALRRASLRLAGYQLAARKVRAQSPRAPQATAPPPEAPPPKPPPRGEAAPRGAPRRYRFIRSPASSWRKIHAAMRPGRRSRPRSWGSRSDPGAVAGGGAGVQLVADGSEPVPPRGPVRRPQVDPAVVHQPWDRRATGRPPATPSPPAPQHALPVGQQDGDPDGQDADPEVVVLSMSSAVRRAVSSGSSSAAPSRPSYSRRRMATSKRSLERRGGPSIS